MLRKNNGVFSFSHSVFDEGRVLSLLTCFPANDRRNDDGDDSSPVMNVEHSIKSLIKTINSRLTTFSKSNP